MKRLVILLIAATTIPTWASDPGEPLDCTDMVFEVSGLHCSLFAWGNLDSDPAGQPGQDHNVFWANGESHGIAVDTLGRIYVARTIWWPQSGDSANRLEIWRHDEFGETRIAFIQGNRPSNIGRDYVNGFGVHFDATTGRLFVWLRSYCNHSGCPDPSEYPETRWIAAVGGFTTTFEILQTYTPAANEISFRVPFIPEGFQYADHFDTYWGDLGTVGDWSQAQPLQCGYPTTAPNVGDYLTVDDTLPALESGRGRYYVTAVTYQGQTRYGRKSSGRVLSGRDPALLPTCLD